ncbi:VanZ family protein [Halorubraceae archaeon YAN]|nr:VanZ family protein [Halorubraceae archaeon YAN]
MTSERAIVSGFMFLLFIASVIPLPSASSNAGTTGMFGPTAVFHLFGYAILAGLLVWSGFSWPIAIGGPILVATGYGAFIEVVQAPIPWRSFSVFDIVLNAIGATIGAVVASRRT